MCVHQERLRPAGGGCLYRIDHDAFATHHSVRIPVGKPQGGLIILVALPSETGSRFSGNCSPGDPAAIEPAG
jgi:hypothetical protein